MPQRSRPLVILAQNIAPVYFWSLLLIGLVIGALAIMLLVRRHLSAHEEAPLSQFTLADLRKMRESGELTEEQFQKLRESVIGNSKTRPRL